MTRPLLNRALSLLAVGALAAFAPARAQVATSDSLALVALYNATNGPEWTNSDGWLTGPVSVWHGVTSGAPSSDSPKRVLQLNLNNNGLSGPIPDALGNLSELGLLWLYGNALTGPIPDVLGNLSTLALLDLSENALTGPVPASFGNLSELSHLGLGGNKLSGSIPSALGNLSALRRLILANNELSGTIPDALGNLPSLEYLSLSSNALSGPIPAALGDLPALREMWLTGNALTGPIPASLGDLSTLWRLWLSGNELSGPIPAALGNLPALTELRLNNNALSGSIPDALGNLSALLSLDLTDNELSGPIPDTLGDLHELRGLFLSRNALTGSIPDALGDLPLLGNLQLSENDLSGPVPVALGGLTTLRTLYLAGNALTGPVPLSYLSLDLTSALFGAGVCVPDNSQFENWIASITVTDLSWPDDICSVALSVSPGALTFDAVSVGADSTRTVTVSNGGSTPVGGSVSLSETDVFSLTSGGGAFTLASGQSLAVDVTFAAVEVGDAVATLSIEHDADGVASPVEVALTGTGVVRRELAVSADSLGFGEVPPGDEASQYVTVTNVGDVATGGLVAVTGDAPFSITDGAGGFDLEPGEYHTITVTFAPPDVLAYEGVLQIDHEADDPETPVVIPLTGGLGEPQIAGVIRDTRLLRSQGLLQRQPLFSAAIEFFEGGYGGSSAGTSGSGDGGVFKWSDAELTDYTVAASWTLSNGEDLVRYSEGHEPWVEGATPDSVRIDLPVGLFNRQLELADALAKPEIDGLSPVPLDLGPLLRLNVTGYDAESIRTLVDDWAVMPNGESARDESVARLQMAEEALLTGLSDSRDVTNEMAEALVVASTALFAATTAAKNKSARTNDQILDALMANALDELRSFVYEKTIFAALEAIAEGTKWASTVDVMRPVILKALVARHRGGAFEAATGTAVDEVITGISTFVADRVLLSSLITRTQGDLENAIALAYGNAEGELVAARDAVDDGLNEIRTRNQAAVAASSSLREAASAYGFFAELFDPVPARGILALLKVFRALEWGGTGASVAVSARRMNQLRSVDFRTLLERPFRPGAPFPDAADAPAAVASRASGHIHSRWVLPVPPSVDAYRDLVAEAVGHVESGDREASAEAAVSLLQAERQLVDGLFVAALPGYAAAPNAEAAAVQGSAGALMESGLQSVFARLGLAVALLGHADGSVTAEEVREQAGDVEASLTDVLDDTAGLLDAVEGAEAAPYVYASSDPSVLDDGATVEVRATVANGGGGPAEDVAVQFTFDGDVLTLVSGPEAVEVGTLAPGQARELAWTLQVAEPDSASASYDVGVTSSNARATGSGGTVELVRGRATPVSSSPRPGSTDLVGAVPNPSLGVARVRFSLAAPADVRIEAYDVTGRRLGVLADGPHEAGAHEVRWNADGLSPGVYLLRMRTGAEVFTRPATIVR
ncbi:choice-of-anchor D domain-containing protein [Rubrivirga sp.]|uniref:choice-of-anchor D domain-containing protein n=1 Tax=Rubrivirga sp. TaxID=1885344 RepID=UPI003B51D919